MRAWLGHHGRCCAAALLLMARTPYASLFNCLVIGIALALPAGLYVVLTSLQASARDLAPAPQVSLFLAMDAGQERVRDITLRIERHAEVRAHRFVPRDEALAELKAATGLVDVAEGLPHNPLPDAFVIEPRGDTATDIAALAAEMGKWPGVAHVQVDSAWAQRLEWGLRFARLAATILAGLFGFALIAVTFNTIRLQMLTRREEVEVARLIGATTGFIRRPLLYSGALQGLGGGIAAAMIVWLVVRALNGPLAELSALYGTRFGLGELGAGEALALAGISAALGWIGSWLSVARHLALDARGDRAR